MKVAIVLLFTAVISRAQDTTFNCNGWSQFLTGSYIVENNCLLYTSDAADE